MTRPSSEHSLAEDLSRQLRWPLRLTFLSLAVESLLRAFWPFLTLLGFAMAAWLLGLTSALPEASRPQVFWALLAALLLALGFGVWRLKWPGANASALALDATMPGQPINAVFDHVANAEATDGATTALWQHHQRAMFTRASQAKAPPPRPQLAKRDRFALRLVAMTVLVAGLLFGTTPGFVTGLSRGGGAVAATGPSWEGWITPPRHANLPARYLPDLPAGPLTIVQGSEVSFRLYGDGLRIRQDIGSMEGQASRARLEVDRAGLLAIEGRDGREWQVLIRPDEAPSIGFASPPRQGEEGRLSLGFFASDDFGVVEAWAEINLDLAAIDRRYHRAIEPEPRGPLTLTLPLPIAGQRVEITERILEDLSQHPYARLPVQITLYARDASDQIGRSDSMAMDLPGRGFFAPMAASVIEQRQALLWHRDNADDAALLLRSIASFDPALRTETSRLGLDLLIERLERAALREPMSETMQSRLAEQMWRLAEQIEDGDLGSALERLRRARERLDQAMRDGASPEEIEELMQEYRDALREWMEELASRSEGNDQPMPEQNGTPMTGQDLQDMMDEIQRLMEEGRVDEAMALLDMLQQMLENMQMMPGGQGGQSGAGLSDTLREQQELSDDAFRDLQQQPGTGQPGPEGEADGPQDEGTGEESSSQSTEDLAERQGELRDSLEDLRDSLPPPGTEPGDAARGALDEAGEAMERAEEALREGDLGRTLNEQAEAIGQMREALRATDRANRGNQERAGRAEDQRDTSESVDPLGRERSGDGAANDGQLGEALDPSDRTRQLEQFLAERLGRRDLDRQERDYLEDLLERF